MGELTRDQFLATEWTLRPLDGLDSFALLFIPYGLVGSINGAYVGNVATGNYSQNKKTYMRISLLFLQRQETQRS